MHYYNDIERMNEQGVMELDPESPQNEIYWRPMDLVIVVDVYGRKHRVRAAHLADPHKTLLPLFTPQGVRYVNNDANNADGKRYLHRGNIAPEGKLI